RRRPALATHVRLLARGGVYDPKGGRSRAETLICTAPWSVPPRDLHGTWFHAFARPIRARPPRASRRGPTSGRPGAEDRFRARPLRVRGRESRTAGGRRSCRVRASDYGMAANPRLSAARISGVAASSSVTTRFVLVSSPPGEYSSRATSMWRHQA